MFAQQSLQPKLSRRRYAGVPYALQNNTVFRRAQNWVSVSDGSRTDYIVRELLTSKSSYQFMCNMLLQIWLKIGRPNLNQTFTTLYHTHGIWTSFWKSLNWPLSPTNGTGLTALARPQKMVKLAYFCMCALKYIVFFSQHILLFFLFLCMMSILSSYVCTYYELCHVLML